MLSVADSRVVDVRLDRDERFDHDLFDSVHDRVVIHTNLVEILFELCQVPLRCHVISRLSTLRLHVVFVLFVDGVVRQVNVLFVYFFGICRILLSSEAHKTLFEHIDLQGVEASDQAVDSEVKLKPVDSVGVRQVLGHDVSGFPFDFLLGPDDLNATPAALSYWLHNVHALVVVDFSLGAETAVVLRENKGLRAKVILFKLSLQAHDVLPHEVFAADLYALREMVDLLELRCLFQVLVLDNASPHDVPLSGEGTHDSDTVYFERIHVRVVNVSGLSHFEPQSHIVLSEVVLLS